MKRLVALYRSPTYSPHAHRQNDTAILDATVDGLERRGWDVVRTGERDVAAGRLPPADVYVNMCQGPAASERLLDLVPKEALAVNPPDSVLNCHRHRLVAKMAARPAPPSLPRKSPAFGTRSPHSRGAGCRAWRCRRMSRARS